MSHATSLPRKISTIKKGEMMILPHKSVAVLMGRLMSARGKGYIPRDFKMKKAQIIIDDKLYLGVAVIK